MSISWLVTNFLAAFLLPPLNLLILGVSGLIIQHKRKKLGKSLIVISLAGMTLLSIPMVSGVLMDSLKPTPIPLTGTEADAIVILGGGRDLDNLEYGGDTLGRFTLERVRYGAWLAKRLRKPILVTGGMPGGGTRSEGEIMRDTLLQEFGVQTRWVEDRAMDTRGNARNAYELLAKDGIHRVFLVSHAWHLRRAVPEFEAAGLTVVPAGTGYHMDHSTQTADIFDFIPTAHALEQSYLAMHEWTGLLWYRIRD